MLFLKNLSKTPTLNFEDWIKYSDLAFQNEFENMKYVFNLSTIDISRVVLGPTLTVDNCVLAFDYGTKTASLSILEMVTEKFKKFTLNNIIESSE